MTARRTHLIRTFHGMGIITTACGRDATSKETANGGFLQVYSCANEERIVDIDASSLLGDVTCQKCLNDERAREMRSKLHGVAA